MLLLLLKPLVKINQGFVLIEKEINLRQTKLNEIIRWLDVSATI